MTPGHYLSEDYMYLGDNREKCRAVGIRQRTRHSLGPRAQGHGDRRGVFGPRCPGSRNSRSQVSGCREVLGGNIWTMHVTA